MSIFHPLPTVNRERCSIGSLYIIDVIHGLYSLDYTLAFFWFYATLYV